MHDKHYSPGGKVRPAGVLFFGFDMIIEKIKYGLAFYSDTRKTEMIGAMINYGDYLLLGGKFFNHELVKILSEYTKYYSFDESVIIKVKYIELYSRYNNNYILKLKGTRSQLLNYFKKKQKYR